MATILLLSGPNLNLLGDREPEIYGTETLEDHVAAARTAASERGLELEHLQSNHEGDLIDAIQGARGRCAAVVINPGAFTHYAWAIRDALEISGLPAIEVHLSDVDAREPFRHVSVLADIRVDAVKVGMLATADITHAVAHALDELPDGTPVVVDPVMVAESGARLLDRDAQDALVALILARATVVTPNMPEARVLAGDAELDAEGLARAVHALGPRAVVVTGGHREEAVDVVFDGEHEPENEGSPPPIFNRVDPDYTTTTTTAVPVTTQPRTTVAPVATHPATTQPPATTAPPVTTQPATTQPPTTPPPPPTTAAATTTTVAEPDPQTPDSPGTG